jgi:RHH-type rel operon transcriptional repressor/antitoxin RelB
MSTTVISISLPGKLVSKINKVSTSLERSKSFLVRKALEQYFEEYAQDLKDHEEATKIYKEYKKSGSKGSSLEEIKKKYKI